MAYCRISGQKHFHLDKVDFFEKYLVNRKVYTIAFLFSDLQKILYGINFVFFFSS